MKIALIDPSLFTLPYDVRLAEGLTSNGNEVVLFGQDPGDQQETAENGFLCRHFYPGLSRRIVRSLPTKLFLTLKGISHFESMLRLLRRLRKWQPDVIHFQWTPLAMIDKHFIPRFRDVAPTVLTVHDSTPYNNSPRMGLQKLGAIEIMGRFDQLIVHTAAARSRLQLYGRKGNINVIPHGLLMDVDNAPTKRLQPIDREIITVLLFGHLKHYKGIDILLQAVSMLPRPLRQRCRIRIVGRPKMPMEPLIKMAEDLQIAKQTQFDFRFVPERDIAQLMAEASILAFPYREIDASGVLMLAIAAGRPIVASKIGLFNEMLEDGKHGALVEPGDPAALAEGLARMLGDENRLSRAADAVRELAASVPTWQTIGSLTEDVYRRANRPLSERAA